MRVIYLYSFYSHKTVSMLQSNLLQGILTASLLFIEGIHKTLCSYLPLVSCNLPDYLLLEGAYYEYSFHRASEKESLVSSVVPLGIYLTPHLQS